jgi:hypothetical protein
MAANCDYVFFPWWPKDGDDWLHHEDTELARRLIPGKRVFIRTRSSGPFDIYTYGEESFRARPVLSYEIDGDGFRVGDHVEVYFRMGTRSLISEIAEMQYSTYCHRIIYRLRSRDLLSEQCYFASDFKRLVPATLPDPDRSIQIAPPTDISSYRLQD